MPRRYSLCSLALACALFGQEFRATITGRVTDAQNGAVPGVKVVATLLTTGAKSETATGPDGLYTIPFLTPGAYRVEAEAPGFKRYLREINAPAGERVAVDIPLEIGQLNETVKVTAEASLLESTTATVGQVIGSTPGGEHAAQRPYAARIGAIGDGRRSEQRSQV